VDGAGRLVCVSAGKGRFQELRLCLSFYEEHIEIAFQAVARAVTPVPRETHFFARGSEGMSLRDQRNGFQPSPRIPSTLHDDNYRTIFPDLRVHDSYFTPPALNFSLLTGAGWFGLGLKELPEGTEFRLTTDRTVLVDAPHSQRMLEAGERYVPPGLVISFSKDGWDGIRVFREIVRPAGLVGEASAPDWWKRPIYCTYGDQICAFQANLYQSLDWDAPGYTTEWVRNQIVSLERRLGIGDFTVVLDAYWQERGCFEPRPSQRFKDMRGLMDWCHGRGHKVLLWTTPFGTFEEAAGEANPIARRYDMLRKDKAGGWRLDLSSDRLREYLSEMAHGFFSGDAGALDADGLKMDFLAMLPSPETFEFSNPRNGTGLRGLARYLSLFHEQSRAIKPDVCLNFSSTDPRVTPYVSLNRLHDVNIDETARESRARLCSESAPETLIDSDGALMFKEWLYSTYVPAALYGTCSLYYSNVLQDGEPLTDEMMQTLGALFKLSAQRPSGRPVFESSGQWSLVKPDGRVVGRTLNGNLVYVFCDDGVTGRLVATEEREQELETFGIRLCDVQPRPEALAITPLSIRARWAAGVLYTLIRESDPQ
jgi:hypothetical protein